MNDFDARLVLADNQGIPATMHADEAVGVTVYRPGWPGELSIFRPMAGVDRIAVMVTSTGPTGWAENPINEDQAVTVRNLEVDMPKDWRVDHRVEKSCGQEVHTPKYKSTDFDDTVGLVLTGDKHEQFIRCMLLQSPEITVPHKHNWVAITSSAHVLNGGESMRYDLVKGGTAGVAIPSNTQLDHAAAWFHVTKVSSLQRMPASMLKFLRSFSIGYDGLYDHLEQAEIAALHGRPQVLTRWASYLGSYDGDGATNHRYGLGASCLKAALIERALSENVQAGRAFLLAYHMAVWQACHGVSSPNGGHPFFRDAILYEKSGSDGRVGSAQIPQTSHMWVDNIVAMAYLTGDSQLVETSDRLRKGILHRPLSWAGGYGIRLATRVLEALATFYHFSFTSREHVELEDKAREILNGVLTYIKASDLHFPNDGYAGGQTPDRWDGGQDADMLAWVMFWRSKGLTGVDWAPFERLAATVVADGVREVTVNGKQYHEGAYALSTDGGYESYAIPAHSCTWLPLLAILNAYAPAQFGAQFRGVRTLVEDSMWRGWTQLNDPNVDQRIERWGPHNYGSPYGGHELKSQSYTARYLYPDLYY